MAEYCGTHNSSEAVAIYGTGMSFMLLTNAHVGWHHSLVKLVNFFGFQKHLMQILHISKKLQVNGQNLLQILYISKKFDRLFLSDISPKKHNLFSFLSGVLSVWPCWLGSHWCCCIGMYCLPAKGSRGCNNLVASHIWKKNHALKANHLILFRCNAVKAYILSDKIQKVLLTPYPDYNLHRCTILISGCYLQSIEFTWKGDWTSVALKSVNEGTKT